MSALPYISVVVPVFNEEENIEPLTRELAEVFAEINRTYEIIFVDDGSTDASPQKIEDLRQQFTGIRVIRFKKNCGQTAAFDAGFKAARGDVVITMDADLQNDPHDIPAMLPLIGQYDLVCGWRHKRNDNVVRRISSRIANGIRNRLSGENIQDTGCSLKVFRREYAQRLKLFTGMHRFFPTLVKFEGGKVAEVKVNHRARKFGTPKYGISNRIMRSFLDLLAVCWMKKRYLGYTIEEQK
jgi:dolichol-phosphate mannosyltransferase